MLPRIWNQRCCRDEIDDQQERRNKAGCSQAARQRHENQRGAETGKSASRPRDESNRADGDGGVGADVAWDEAGRAHPRKMPPVLFVTSVTILAADGSISLSVM